MTLFLRNAENRSIVDIDCYVKTEYYGEPKPMKFIELNSTVIIDTYSKFLLENLDKKDEIISDFEEINELRGWLWQSCFMGDENDPSKYDDVIRILRELLKAIAVKYQLNYVED